MKKQDLIPSVSIGGLKVSMLSVNGYYCWMRRAIDPEYCRIRAQGFQIKVVIAKIEQLG